MGWSVPHIPARPEIRPWSPWVCLLLIIAGILISFFWVILVTSNEGLTALSRQYWLLWAVKTLTCIAIAITIYLLWWEVRSFMVWNWNNWCHNMELLWRKRAHQHLYVVEHLTLISDPSLIPSLAGITNKNYADEPSVNIIMEQECVPGISRFENICLHLIKAIKPSLQQRYPVGKVAVLVKTSSSDKKAELAVIKRILTGGTSAWRADIEFLSDSASLSEWNQQALAYKFPVIVFILHYRQPDEILPEFASVLLILPEEMLYPDEYKTALRNFHAMPVNISILKSELAELRDMEQIPAARKRAVWHFGLPEPQKKGVARILNELSINLYKEVAVGGVIDFEEFFSPYKELAGWIMMASAIEMASYALESHWLVYKDNKISWAVALGNSASESAAKPSVNPSPAIPFGSIMLALLTNLGFATLMTDYYPELMLSWQGGIIFLILLVIMIPVVVFVLRSAIQYLQFPRFVNAGRKSGKV